MAGSAGRDPVAPRWRRLSIVGIGAAVIALDQVSKTWALGHARDPVHVIGTLRFAVTFNSGTAFGLGQDSTAIIVAGVVVLVVVLLGLGRRASRSATWPAAVAMGLLLGGALGNLADRLIRHHHGAVIDFIDLRWWPVFNVADAAISVGAVVLALVLFRSRPAPGASTGLGTGWPGGRVGRPSSD
ncbi:MAG: signal peptidase II [Actinomycetota bacterium]|nr:signal peptidase II [Actinomycetota bacterium]